MLKVKREGSGIQSSRALAQSRGTRNQQFFLKKTSIFILKILSLPLLLPFSPMFLIPSFLLTQAHLASPVLHPFVPLVKKLLEGQTAVPEKVP